MYFILFYETVDNYVERRVPYRDQHLAHARAAHERGELFMGGALVEPADGAVLVFQGKGASVAAEFAENDPYVLNGLITSALRRKWYPSSTRGARPDKIRQSCEAEVNLMPGPKPVTIQLSAEERQAVEKLVRRHSAPQQIALRGRIVLAADDGHNNSQIARELSTSLKTVRRWRRRWLVLQPIALEDLSVEERLEDLARPGAPPRITADQRCRIESMACEEPEDSGRPISHWTSREIADEIMKRGIVRQISPRHAARLLKR